MPLTPLLPLLLELQSVHDNLRTIRRDLAAFPPDMARLDGELKALRTRRAQAAKALEEGLKGLKGMEEALKVAQKSEDLARASVKQAHQKVQYAAAIRDLDERERQRAAAARPLKELQAKVAALETEVGEADAKLTELQAQFDELHQIFLSEHETQVVAKAKLETRLEELEAALPTPERVRFNKLLDARQGRAIVPVEKGFCSGCRTRLRIPLIAQVRDRGPIPCESCLRLVYIAPAP